MSTWERIKAAWSQGWQALERRALELHRSAIQKEPRAFAPKVEAYARELRQARVHLDRMRPMLPSPARAPEDQRIVEKHRALEARYHELAAGLYADTKPAEGIGVVPLVVVAGLAVGVAGIAWSVAAYEYAVNLREQTALAEKELAARVDASRAGRTLQTSTLPAPPDSGPKRGGLGWLLVGGLVLASGAIALPVLLKHRG
jgi:hypothetical protein